MSFVACDPASHKGKTNTWLTPKWIIDALGPFDLDPCGHPGHRTAERLICLPEDGLIQHWQGRVWLNPPYGKHAGDWLKKLIQHGNGIALVFARTDTEWLQSIIKFTPIFFIKGRIKFLRDDGSEATNSGAPNILLPFGEKNIDAILRSGIKGVMKI